MSSLQFALSLLSVSAKGVKRGEDGNLKQDLLLGVLVLEEKLPMGRWLLMSMLSGFVKIWEACSAMTSVCICQNSLENRRKIIKLT